MMGMRLRCVAQKRLLNHKRYLTTLGIRREDPRRIWERRAPLTPDAVEELLETRGTYAGDNELCIEVESCRRRCFPDEAYEAVGATIVPELSGAVDVVLGIKEPPVSTVKQLLNGPDGQRTRKWAVFSHTHKGQIYNTPLLSSYLDTQQFLLDWELLTGPTEGRGKTKLERVAAFGWYAGVVGAGEALTLLGLAQLKRGISTPLLHHPRPYTFSTLWDYQVALRKTGEKLRDAHVPGRKPQVIGVTGSGKVAKGAEHVLRTLGAHPISADKLSSISSGARDAIYYCMIPPSAYFRSQDGAAWDRSAYYAEPSRWKSDFGEKIAPHLTTLINGAGWAPGFPRIMDTAALQTLSDGAGGLNLAVVQDVTCDIAGNLEFVDRHTTIDDPYYVGKRGILISSIDILPTELPIDSSRHFSNCILPYVKRLTTPKQAEGSEEELQQSLERATIVREGVLTSNHAWLQKNIDEWKAKEAPGTPEAATAGSGDRVLLLGSGMVAGPAVEVFCARADVRLAVGSNNLKEAQKLLTAFPNAKAFELDISDKAALGKAVAEADVVVSLLPAPMHVQVAEHCIAHGRHLVTASYLSPEMKALDQRARDKNVLLLGECGLDPGIDSMAAMRIMDRVKREKKTVTSFKSWCGGLPELSAADNILKYKFSWSPKGALTAALNPAYFKLDGSERKIPGDRLLEEHFGDVALFDLPLEGVGNRDSMPYAEKYGLPPASELRDLFRGTLRYKGFSTTMAAFKRLGLLDQTPLPKPVEKWADFLPSVMQARNGQQEVAAPAGDQIDLRKALAVIVRLASDHRIRGPLPHLRAPIDLFADLLSLVFAYEPGERDLILLHHEFGLTSASGDERVTAALEYHGNEKASAMATTVGKTLAFAALRVLDGDVKGRGVTGPYEREVWEGVLDSLEKAGVRVEETWAKV